MENKNSNYLKGIQGYTLVELVTVLAIMAILGTMLMSMLDTGVKFYSTADSMMDIQNNDRLAMAYITVKIRQNDVAGGISVVSESDSSGNLIKVLQINDARNTSGNSFWIYFESNKLFQHYGTDFAIDPVNDTEIADKLQSVDIEQPPESNSIQITVKSINDSAGLTSSITLRSSL